MSTKNIMEGTDDRITRVLGRIINCDERFSTITFARKVASFTGDLKLVALVNDLWRDIEENWKAAKAAGCGRGGSQNWRWEPKLSMHPNNPSEETRLEKGLATVLPKQRWANQVPTASGLIAPTADKKRNIDLAHWDEAERVTLVELKVATNTPVYAAFEIVRNALLLCLARKHQEEINIARKDVWAKVKEARLLVVAPKQFYDQLNRDGTHYSLGRFEGDLSAAISNFGGDHGFRKMSFGFRVFDLTDVLLNAIETAHAYAP